MGGLFKLCSERLEIMRMELRKGKKMNVITIMVITLFFAIRLSPDLLANYQLWTSTFILFVAVCALQIIRFRVLNFKRDGAFLFWYLPFFTVCYFSRYWANNSEYAKDGMSILIVILLSFGVLSFLIENEDDIYVFIKILLLSIIVMFIDLALNIQWSSLFTARLGLENINQNWNSNTLGITLASFIFLSIALIRERRMKHPTVFVVLSIMFCFFVLLSGSRTSLIAVVLFLSLYYAFEKRGKTLKFVFVAIILTFVVYLLIMNVPILYKIIGYRFSGMFGDEKEGSFIGRSKLIINGFEWFLQKPLLGYGFNNFRTMNVWGVYAHCNYIELLVGVGLMGTFLYYSAYIKLIFVAKRMKTHKSFILAVAYTGLFIDISNVSYLSFPWICLLFICLCFVKIENVSRGS